MSLPLTLRRVADSRLLRVIALLGWLLMTVFLPAANVMAGETPASHAAAGSPAMMAAQHADHCCGGTAHPQCHCETLCGSVMLPSVPPLFGPMRLADVHVSMRGIDAPAPESVPPLRPPAA